MNILGLITLVSGLYFIIFSFIQNTRNLKSAIIYRVIPFFCGVGCVIVALSLFNIILLNI